MARMMQQLGTAALSCVFCSKVVFGVSSVLSRYSFMLWGWGRKHRESYNKMIELQMLVRSHKVYRQACLLETWIKDCTPESRVSSVKLAPANLTSRFSIFQTVCLQSSLDAQGLRLSPGTGTTRWSRLKIAKASWTATLTCHATSKCLGKDPHIQIVTSSVLDWQSRKSFQSTAIRLYTCDYGFINY